ncbi:hypothetical protein AMAG_00029 [Allomyces macrogynus ATCC 38327]|uniref:Major facilitator superfamily (MFS) profile domain-containing protein n=1 Tax=Allomyces macrogynus (strain ATCC 38327) TaxID=578462 RepID=A0A0L0RV81_ALLM3|nr:hypothetical protein AMAG_00029 [Allomyces macrogynus ATCC 38327]|eukprot:KNE54029.1 hypothetical protein AMAG_00029 [Allomyces macrogynus ATCC 38327]
MSKPALQKEPLSRSVAWLSPPPSSDHHLDAVSPPWPTSLRSRTATVCSTRTYRSVTYGTYAAGDLATQVEDEEAAPASCQRTPLPMRSMAVLLVCILSEPFSLSVLFPFVYFMVRDFHVTDDEAQLGYFVGFLASAFSIAQFLTSALWGWTSDNWGRRPVLLIGLIGNTLSMLSFGLSRDLTWAIASRLVCGLLNGNIGVAKCVLGEICDETNMDDGFALFGLGWGMGGIVGPMIGGLLSNSATRWPWLGNAFPFLVEYPYFLPCLVSAIVSLVGFIMGFIFLEESHPGVRAASHRDEHAPLLLDSTIIESVETLAPPPAASISAASYHAIVGYALIALHTIIFDEVYALFAVQPLARGGLAMTPAQVGTSLAVMGCMEFVLQLTAYPAVARRFTLRKVYAWALVGYPVAYAMFPMVAMVLGARDWGVYHDAVLWTGVLFALGARLVCCVMGFTAVMVMINNSAPTEYLGRVNGLGQTAAAAVRGIGPALGTTVFAWSLSSGLSFPLDHELIWVLLASVCVVQVAHAMLLPESLNRKHAGARR